MKCGICKKNIASSEEYGHVSLDYDSHTLSRNGTQVALCLDCDEVVWSLVNSVRERGGSEADVFDTIMVLQPAPHNGDEILWQIRVRISDDIDVPVMNISDPDYLPYLKACADHAGATECTVFPDGTVAYKYKDRPESRVYVRDTRKELILDGQ